MKITQVLRRAGLVVGLLAAISCDSGPMEVQWSDGLRIMFVGNSITYWHDTPSIVAALVDSAGIGADTVASATHGGWSLRDHWNFGRASEMIATGGWDVVVLQGAGGSQDSLLKYAQLFGQQASRVGARTALFMPNPNDSHIEFTDQIAAAYTDVARQINAVLLPVALAWREVLARDSTIQLYSDAVHPNLAGSYLAGLVIFRHLTGRSPVGLPATLTLDRAWYPTVLDLSPKEAALLQQVAAEVGESYGTQ